MSRWLPIVVGAAAALLGWRLSGFPATALATGFVLGAATFGLRRVLPPGLLVCGMAVIAATGFFESSGQVCTPLLLDAAVGSAMAPLLATGALRRGIVVPL